MKYCKDCIYLARSFFGLDVSQCKHPDAATGESMVTGRGGSYCDYERYNGKCGREAKNFAPKKGGAGL